MGTFYFMVGKKVFNPNSFYGCIFKFAIIYSLICKSNCYGGDMKTIVTVFLFIFSMGSFLFSGTPVIDGVFDGEAVWGPPVAVADGVAGWSNVNIDKIYVTYDDNYVYFAGLFVSGGEPAPWMRAAFDFNVKTDGGPYDPWGEAVIYDYQPSDQKPDFVIVGRLGDDANWAEIRSWDGTDWDNGGGVDHFGTDMAWTVDLNCIEARISKDSLGDATNLDVQFYVSGNNYSEHGTFDACPDDSVTPDWYTQTPLDNYAENIDIGQSLAISSEPNAPAENFVLYQNYPNPFGRSQTFRDNASTTIRYQLLYDSDIRLTVYNTRGQVVRVLVNERQPSGLHQAVFDASNLASGVYVYRLETKEGFSQFKKMLLIR